MIWHAQTDNISLRIWGKILCFEKRHRSLDLDLGTNLDPLFADTTQKVSVCVSCGRKSV